MIRLLASRSIDFFPSRHSMPNLPPDDRLRAQIRASESFSDISSDVPGSIRRAVSMRLMPSDPVLCESWRIDSSVSLPQSTPHRPGSECYKRDTRKAVPVMSVDSC